MTSRYRTRPQVKFKAFRDLERRRVEASDTVWALLVGSKLAEDTMAQVGDQKTLLADEYPDLPYVGRMNQRLDRAAGLLSHAERELCAMALNYAFGLHEDFLRACIGILVPLGKASNGDKKINSDELHERIQLKTGHVMNPDSLAIFHLTRHLRNAHTHAAGLVRTVLVDYFISLDAGQAALWSDLTGEPFVIPKAGDVASIGVPTLVGALAVQKRLAYDVNLALQAVIPRATWVDMAIAEYLAESGKPVKDPSLQRSVKGYLRGGYSALKLTDAEIEAGVSRL